MWKASIFEIRDNGIAILTFNKPQRLNAMGLDLYQDIKTACQVVREDEKIKVLIITGAGRGFSAGGNIGDLLSYQNKDRLKLRIESAGIAVQTLYDLNKPVIAAVNGPVAGAGLSLMMACDLVIASENAVFGFTFSQIAFCPDCGCSYFLFNKVGHQKAAEILYFGKILDSKEAAQLGLVNKVVPEGKALEQSLEWAEKLIKQPLFTVGLNKKLLRQACNNSYHQQVASESAFQVLAWSSEDFKEGANAFLEKRQPSFRGI